VTRSTIDLVTTSAGVCWCDIACACCVCVDVSQVWVPTVWAYVTMFMGLRPELVQMHDYAAVVLFIAGTCGGLVCV
jgi:hypothetical protein